MTKDELIVGAASLVFTCVLLGLRQLIVGGRKSRGVFIRQLARDDGDSRADDPSNDWPSEIAITEEPASGAKVSSEGTTTAGHAGIFSALALLSLCGAFDAARAQQTIFNVPSTDMLDRGKVYAELDASFKPNNSEAQGRFPSFVPRVVGAGGRVEVGLNVTGNVQPGPDTTTLVPVIKYKFYDGKGNSFRLVGGDHLFIPVRHRAYNAGNYLYLELSKTFKKRGTRLTAGGYDFTKSVVAAASRAGGQFGFEQPGGKKVTLAADYFTGKHAAGYFTPGVLFRVGPKVTGYAGYSIGNQNPSRGNHFFLLELGYNFN